MRCPAPQHDMNTPALCRQRFSLLFYGLGSKRALLEAFADETLTDGGVLACDGLAPGINAKQVRHSATQVHVQPCPAK